MITVIDSIMGSGKTTFIVKYINEKYSVAPHRSFDDETLERPKFIYVAPLLSEVERILEACPSLRFREPVPVDRRKLNHLEALIEGGRNICTTHSLFKLLTKEICHKLIDQGYILIIDETLECVSLYDDLSKNDKDMLLRERMIYVDESTKLVCWNNDLHKNYKGKFEHVRHLCENGNLTMSKQNAIVWTFPTEFIKAFDDVFILTYLFSGSLMASYLEAEGLTVEMTTLNEHQELVAFGGSAMEVGTKAKLRELITVYDGGMNKHGDKVGKSNPFSSGWLGKQNDTALLSIKGSTEHFFKSVAKTPANENAWTTFSKAKKALKGDRYSRGFIPCNAKATNDYRTKRSLAYLCNVFHQPPIMSYFREREIEVDQDAFALSEMVQWIWRSQIRDGKPIVVFIPSNRMRTLFLAWLNEQPRTALAA